MTAADRPVADRPVADRPVGGWLFVDLDRVPERWQARVRPMALVPLLPEEADELLATGQVSDPVGDEFGAEFLRLVGAGASQADIAKHLGMSSRTVERKFALLRERVGVGTRAALVAELARRGW